MKVGQLDLEEFRTGEVWDRLRFYKLDIYISSCLFIVTYDHR